MKNVKTSLKKGLFVTLLETKVLINSFLKGGTVRDHIQIRVGLRHNRNNTNQDRHPKVRDHIQIRVGLRHPRRDDYHSLTAVRDHIQIRVGLRLHILCFSENEMLRSETISRSE